MLFIINALIFGGACYLLGYKTIGVYKSDDSEKAVNDILEAKYKKLGFPVKMLCITLLTIILSLSLYLGSDYLKEQSNVKRAAWEQLGPEGKNFIKGNWRSGKVRKVTLSQSMGNITDEAYVGKDIYVVSFTTKEENPTIKTIGIFLSIEDYKIIGTGHRD